MSVGRDGDQLVPGAAPELQDGPALPLGLGPVEVDGRPASGEHPVVQPSVRVEIHGARQVQAFASRWTISVRRSGEVAMLSRTHPGVPGAYDAPSLTIPRPRCSATAAASSWP